MPRHFPHWLKAYCDFTSTSEAPLEFHFWTGVSTIAAVLRRRVWKDEHYFKWTPNFYIIFVGPPGVVTKSTTLNLGYQFLRNVKGVRFGPDSMTWQALAKKFEDAFEYFAWIDTGGVEHKASQSALTCSISELGTFLKADDTGLISFLTDVWDGKDRPFSHSTVTSLNLTIENPWLNIIGATTPEWMQNNFPQSLLSEGIGSRIVFVFGDQKRHLVAYPSRVVKPLDWAEQSQRLLDDLIHISTLAGPYELTEDAYKWGYDWYETHHGGRERHMASARYGGYLARKQTHMHKLAMVLAASKRDALIIEKEDLEEANLILSQAEQSMIQVFQSVGVVDEARHVAEIVAFVRAYEWITGQDLYRLCYNIMSEKDFKHNLHVALECNLLEVELREGVRGVRPKPKVIH